MRALYLAALATAGLLAAPAGAAADAWETITPGGDTVCSDGSPYQFHLRRGSDQHLLIFFNGGGACWNSGTCDPRGNPTYRVTAGVGSGNDPREYDGAFALENPENPFGNWSQVFVSYCTGDVHLGDREADYRRDKGDSFRVQHRGRRNADAVLAHVYQTFTDPALVVVAGGSAGALASPVYAAVLADHYRDARVVQLGGGGAGYRLPPPTQLWQQWGVIPALPPLLEAGGVAATDLHIMDLYRLAAKASPGLSFHTYDNAYDAVQEQFLAMLGAPGELLPGLDANLADLRADVPALRSFVAPDEFHTLLRFSELYTRESDGVRAVDWVGDIVAGRTVVDVHCPPDTCLPAVEENE
jgi:pimeloyl-ACP methyl ester carboxylesterase